MEKFRGKFRIESNRLPGWDYAGNGQYFITLVIEHRYCVLGGIKNHKMIFNEWGLIARDEWRKSFEIRSELFCDEYVIMPNHLHAIVTIVQNTPSPELTKNGNHAAGDLNGGGIGDGIGGIDDVDNVVETHGRASLRSSEQRSSEQRSSGQPPEQPSKKRHQSENQNQQHRAPQQSAPQWGINASHPSRPFIRKPKSLSSFIAGYKSAVTHQINNWIDQHPENRIFSELEKFNRNNHLWQPNYYDHIIRNQEEYCRIARYIQNNPANWQEDKFFEI